MKISEAIEQLEYLKLAEGDVEIWKSKDDEGNAFFPLSSIQNDWFHVGDRTAVADEDVENDEYERDELTRVVTVW